MQIRDLVMGPGTNYVLLAEVNPWNRRVRADQGGPRAWAHGSWSGAEWADEVVVPIPVRVEVADGTPAGWLTAHQQLAAAFAPSSTDVELRIHIGGGEYLLYGRPRLVEPDATNIAFGYAVTRCGFVALDPLIYAGSESQAVLNLPLFTGGLTVPVTAPFTIGATRSQGFADITNAGTVETGLELRIDGPVSQPRVTLVSSGGSPQTVTVDIVLGATQWLDIDTKARTVLLNGVSSRRGQASGDWPLLPAGTHEVRYAAAEYNNTSTLTVSWRSAWW